MWGMMVYDSIRALDYLETRPDIDAGRIGTLGLSMGSTMAWWLAALDERVKVCVDLCCLTDFEALMAHRVAGRARAVLLRAGAAEAFHERADQRADRAAGAFESGGDLRPADAAGWVGSDRYGIAGGVWGGGGGGGVAAVAARVRAYGDGGDAGGGGGVFEGVAMRGPHARSAGIGLSGFRLE